MKEACIAGFSLQRFPILSDIGRERDFDGTIHPDVRRTFHRFEFEGVLQAIDEFAYALPACGNEGIFR